MRTTSVLLALLLWCSTAEAASYWQVREQATGVTLRESDTAPSVTAQEAALEIVVQYYACRQIGTGSMLETTPTGEIITPDDPKRPEIGALIEADGEMVGWAAVAVLSGYYVLRVDGSAAAHARLQAVLPVSAQRLAGETLAAIKTTISKDAVLKTKVPITEVRDAKLHGR